MFFLLLSKKRKHSDPGDFTTEVEATEDSGSGGRPTLAKQAKQPKRSLLKRRVRRALAKSGSRGSYLCCCCLGRLATVLLLGTLAAFFYLYFYHGLSVHVAFNRLERLHEKPHRKHQQQQQDRRLLPLAPHGAAAAAAQWRRANAPAPGPTQFLRLPRQCPLGVQLPLFLVASTDSPQSRVQREAVRKSWGAGGRRGAAGGASFVIAFAFPVAGASHALLQESQKYDDLILMRAPWQRQRSSLILDAMFRMRARCSAANYIVRTNDRALWNPHQLLESVGLLRPPGAASAGIAAGRVVQRLVATGNVSSGGDTAGRFQEHKWLAGDPGYVLTSSAVDALERAVAAAGSAAAVETAAAAAAADVDVYLTGSLRVRAGVRIANLGRRIRITRQPPRSPCQLWHRLAWPDLSAGEMVRLWAAANSRQLQCPPAQHDLPDAE